MTFAELKAQLVALTPEQLAMDVVWSGDERGGKVESLWIAEEDWIDNGDGDVEPRSVVAKNVDDYDATSVRIVIAKGSPRLVVD